MADAYPGRYPITSDEFRYYYVDGNGAWWKCNHLFAHSLRQGPSAAAEGTSGASFYWILTATNDYVFGSMYI